MTSKDWIYVTTQGDVLDRICARRYGSEQGAVERVLRANPGLAAFGPRLPAGLRITLPAAPATAPARAAPLRLWD